jgi:hypothetical protein
MGEVPVAAGNVAPSGESTQQGSGRCRDPACDGVIDKGS